MTDTTTIRPPLRSVQDVEAWAKTRNERGKRRKVAYLPLFWDTRAGKPLWVVGDDLVGPRFVWRVISVPLMGTCVAVERIGKRSPEDMVEIDIQPHTDVWRAARVGCYHLLATQHHIDVRDFIRPINRIRQTGSL